MAEQPALNTAAELMREGFGLVARPYCVAAFDPAGQGSDHPALVVEQREEWQRGEPTEPRFAVRHLYRVLRAEKLPPGSELPDLLARLFRLARSLMAEGAFSGWKLAIEANGIGAAYVSALRRRLTPGAVLGVTTVHNTIGDVPCADSGWVMPRQAALDNLRAASELRVLKFIGGAPGAKDLVREMQSMVWSGGERVSSATRRRPEAAQGAHDDMVMALCLAHWTLTRIVPPVVRGEPLVRRAA